MPLSLRVPGHYALTSPFSCGFLLAVSGKMMDTAAGFQLLPRARMTTRRGVDECSLGSLLGSAFRATIPSHV